MLAKTLMVLPSSVVSVSYTHLALGAVSRLSGEAIGSAMTFANPGQASAPVSYTHLDVYKRQGVSSYTSSFDLAQTCVFGKQLLGPIPVSYTHLTERSLFSFYFPSE